MNQPAFIFNAQSIERNCTRTKSDGVKRSNPIGIQKNAAMKKNKQIIHCLLLFANFV